MGGRFSIVIMLLILLSLLARAKEEPPLIIPRVEKPPAIDGTRDEIWNQALELKDFSSLTTCRKAILPTTAYLMHDSDFLYVIIVCFDDMPREIHAVQSVRNSNLWIDDSVSLYLDTFKDGKGYYVFTVNPRGTQSCLSTRDIGWDTDWKAGACVGAEGWIAEMAIPFKDLKRTSSDVQEWGINVARSIKRLDETCVWNFVDINNSLVPLYFRAFSIEPKKAKPKPEVIIDGIVMKAGTNDTAPSTSGTMARFGANVRYPVSPNMDGTVTIQPDFSELQREELTIVPQETEVYYGEYRTFFQEGAGYFSTPGPGFYSRRIQNLDWGAKLTGRTGQFRIGALSTSAASEKDAVMVLKSDMLKNRLTVGGMWMQKETPGAGADSENQVFFSYTPVKEISMDACISRHNAQGASTGAASASLYVERGRWWGGGGWRRVEPGFNPALSYVPLQNVEGTDWILGYFKDYDKGPLFSRDFFIEYENLHTIAGQPAVESMSAAYSCTMRKPWGWSVWGNSQYFMGNIDKSLSLSLRFNPRFWDCTSLSYSFGEFHSRPTQNLSWSTNMFLSKTTRLSLGYEWVHYITDAGIDTVPSFKRVSLYREFNPDTTATLSLRIDEQSRLNAYLVFRRHLKVKSDIYLIIGDPNTSVTSSKVLLKVTYKI
jgi:hypothetical protein